MPCSRPARGRRPRSMWLSLALTAAVSPYIFASAPVADTPDLAAELQSRERQATAVVVATVVSSESQWLDGRLMTLAEVSVEERLRGSTPDEVTLLIAGGVDMNRRIPVAAVVPGQPRLDVGERAVLFLVPAEGAAAVSLPPDLYTVVADVPGVWAQGEGLDALRSALREQTGGAR